MTTVAEPADLLSMVGTDLGATDWVDLTRERIDGFASATAVDAGTVGADSDECDGYLLLSMVNLFLPDLLTVERFSMGVNVGLEQVRFGVPATVGSRVRARGEVAAASEEKGGVQVTVRVTIEQDVDDSDGAAEAEAVCVADTVSRFFP